MNNKDQIAFGLLGLVVGAAITAGVFLSMQGDAHTTTYDVPESTTATAPSSAMDHSNMTTAMHGMTSALEGKAGDEFDKQFLSEMIEHHEGAVVMAQQVLATSKRPELIKLANDIISAQTTEIAAMKSWQTNWFGR